MTPAEHSVLRKVPTHPFAALMDPEFRRSGWKKAERDGDRNLSVNELKDAILRSFSAADRFDGHADASVEIEQTCGTAPEICKGADTNGDAKLSIDEYLNRVDTWFERADVNHNGTLQAVEISRLGGKM